MDTEELEVLEKICISLAKNVLWKWDCPKINIYKR